VRRSSLVRLVASAVLAATVAATGLVAASGSSQAATQHFYKFRPYYISIGDSYSVGYQNPALGNTSGFTGYVAGKEKLTLENFGCGGATTSSLFTQIGCPAGASAATNGVPYPTTNQVAAAIAFINAHPGEVALVTVSISGNDVTSCAAGSNPIPCVLAASSAITTNVTNLVSQLDAALTANSDTNAHIVGITYPDVILGNYLVPLSAPNPTLAALSVVAFDAIINPALNTAYTSVARGAFVNVTSAPYKKATAGDDTGTFDTTTGAYTGPTAHLPSFGRSVPAAVDEVCTLTWYCDSANLFDIHANTRGYHFIGKLIVAKLGTL
jgi:lysophospholipase L1-like esterase